MGTLVRWACVTTLVWASMAHANISPASPVITEPAIDGHIVNPSDVHMETAPFDDTDVTDTHVCSDFEIWTITPDERVWVTECIGGVEKVHTHLGDGVFENSHEDFTELLYDTNYKLRVRHKDSSGDPATEWSDWSERLFQTGPPTAIFPLAIEDVVESPAPVWQADNGDSIALPDGVTPASMTLESPTGSILLRLEGSPGGNTSINPGPQADHVNVRVRINAGSNPAGLPLPDHQLTFTDDDGDQHTVFLPSMLIAANSEVLYWIAIDGSSYHASPGQTEPDFTRLARGSAVPWTVRQVGYKVEVVATGFQLPVNIAFVPNPGQQPDSPFYYVTELYGTIKVVTKDGTISDYVTGLLDFNPTGNFPGSGEQGLTGIVVEPATGDVIAAYLYEDEDSTRDPKPHYPKVVRFHSNDGGLTAATETTLLDMFGEMQGQSHQISNLSIGPDGKLYVHMGDGFRFETAPDLESFRGKVLRMNLDGSVPTNPPNPFYNASDGITAKDYIFAYGLRNPFGGAWRALDGKHYGVENGPSQDRMARIDAGLSYGWDGTNDSMTTRAIYVWNPATAPVNIAFIQPSTFNGSGFPAGKMDHAFVSESGPTYATGPQSRGKRITEFALGGQGQLLTGPATLVEYTGSGKGSAVALAAGPDGLYFSDFYKDLNYQSPIDRGANILRIRYVGSADFTADVVTGPAPLAVQFTDFSDVPGITSWEWTFGDGATSTQQNPSHIYESIGPFTVRLRVVGATGVSVMEKMTYIRVGEFPLVAFIGGTPVAGLADQAMVDHVRGYGFEVDYFYDEPAQRPTATALAGEYDLVLISSSVRSNRIENEFASVAVPVVYWEQALNRVDREPLASKGVVNLDQSQIEILDNTHPVTTAAPLGHVTVLDPPSRMSVAWEEFGPGVQQLALRGDNDTQTAIMVAETGAELLGEAIAPARRVFLFLEDQSWFDTTPVARQIFDQAVYWALGKQIPTSPADFDGDRDVDLDDFQHFAGCITGANIEQTDPECADARLDGDNDVDHSDFGIFQTCLSGESKLADVDCGR